MDNKDLKEQIKEKGLEGLEDVVQSAVEEAYELVKVVIEASNNKVAMSLLGLIMMTKPIVLGLVDKIDSKEG